MEKSIKSFAEYTLLASATDNPACMNKERHYLLGISSEIGEMCSCLKKFVGYNRPLDIVNLGEEMGDILWFISQLVQLKYPNGPISKMVFEKEEERENLDRETTLFEGIMQLNLIFARIIWSEKEDKNYQQELYDMVNVLSFIGKLYDFNLAQLAWINIQKLAVRFPEKFDSQREMMRDLGLEYQTLSKK